MKHGTVTISGQPIAYRESTGSGRPIVLVHGNSSSSRTWQRLLDSTFGATFRCLAVDLPGHGASAVAADPASYSLPGYAQIVGEFADALRLRRAVYVGWSLGGHVVLEAAATGSLPDPAGLAIFGTPPVADAAAMGNAFLPNPAMNVGFSAQVSADDALAYAISFVAPHSGFALDDFVTDILATDGAARAGLLTSIGAGRFADEVAAAQRLRIPIAILHGRNEQLVNLAYLQGLSVPTLWRGAVQVVEGAGHAPHEERPHECAALLSLFAEECP